MGKSLHAPMGLGSKKIKKGAVNKKRSQEKR